MQPYLHGLLVYYTEQTVLVNSNNVTQISGIGVILTSYFGFATDPRNKGIRKQSISFETIYHIYSSALHNKLHLLMFHDEEAFDPKFVERYSHAPYISFIQVDSPSNASETNPNDYRFTVFHEYMKTHRNQYKWYLIADRDMIFNRNPFIELDEYQAKDAQNFFGSYDGGTWTGGAQGVQFRKCYGENLTSTWTHGEQNTFNGCCGLWAGTYPLVQCILKCMAEQFASSPVKSKGAEMPCDMAVHDYCVFYGGCFPNSTKGTYSTELSGVLWGPATLGENNSLFGPTVSGTAKQMACISDSWTVSHCRCGKRQKWPICFNHTTLGSDGPLRKYFQKGYPNEKRCNLDNETDLPLPNKV